MKKILLIWLAPIFLYAQFTDDFTTFEGWLGDTAEFSIDRTELLQLTAPPETGKSDYFFSRFYFDRIGAK